MVTNIDPETEGSGKAAQAQFAAIGKHTYYSQLAESHQDTMHAALMALRHLVDMWSARPVAFSADRAVILIDLARRGKSNFLKCANAANDAAKVCGQPLIPVE